MTPQRAPAKTFRDLVVWQKAHQFVLGAYKYFGEFPHGASSDLMSLLEEVSRILDAYAKAILTPDS